MAATSLRWLAALRLPHPLQLPGATSGSSPSSAMARRPAPRGRLRGPGPRALPPLTLLESESRPGGSAASDPSLHRHPHYQKARPKSCFPPSLVVVVTWRSKPFSVWRVFGEGGSCFEPVNVSIRGPFAEVKGRGKPQLFLALFTLPT